jgi:hypothetical protein
MGARQGTSADGRASVLYFPGRWEPGRTAGEARMRLFQVFRMTPDSARVVSERTGAGLCVLCAHNSARAPSALRRVVN